MKRKIVTIQLPEGKTEVEALCFENSDITKIQEIYKAWIHLSNLLNSIEARRVNLPEGLSEAVFCLCMNTVRTTKSITGKKMSFDCYDLEAKKRIQVKACSTLPDLTSFGPASVWDKLYFMDFSDNKKFEGNFKIYEVDNCLIYNNKVNKSQTMKDQQKQKRRPRFSVYNDIIKKYDINPIFSGNIFDLGEKNEE